MIEFLPLEQLLDGSRDAALAASGPCAEHWRRWRQRVGQWRLVLEAEAGDTWALYDNNAFEFSAALFALWSLGKTACVPGSNQPLICARLQERVAGFIGEFPTAAGYRTLAPPALDAEAVAFASQLDRQQLAMEIFTSGSSGEPQSVPKQLFQLSEEVNNLERLWGPLVEGAEVAATVSHHHIYGLLFRVLWPLGAGRVFPSHASEYLEELNLSHGSDQPLMLVSSPSHLSRIPPQTDWAVLRRRCRAIFSSGAPLSKEASLSAAQHLGFAPIEVYGSSETGGIAWRQQGADRETAWQTLPGVVIAVEPEAQCLQIQSPYLAPMPDDSWYVTSDRVQLDGETEFYLLGRVDRIAKVEGKRVSLDEVEQRLASHAFVAEARVVVLDGRRSELAAAIVLSADGAAYLGENGRRPLNNLFAEHLLQQFERPLVPRRWRYPSRLPANSQGKVTYGLLSELFSHAERSRPRLPDVVTASRGEGKASLLLRVPADLLYFEGHFPVAAILPGVVQLKWANHFGLEYLGFAGEFSRLEAVKFQQVVRPGQELYLELELKGDKDKLAFRYHSAAGQHASGRIVMQI